ncbi:MAG: tRNA 2-thiouridine(34) synthase MnmA [Magnetococcus sp. YQC-5]
MISPGSRHELPAYGHPLMPTGAIQGEPGRVAVALSGGVDSSTVAALLKRQGFEVIGLTMQLWDQGKARSGPSRTCCALEDIHDARRVAQTLDIPFYVINLEAEFQRAVVDDFIASYASGRTPNPCVLCNQQLKFHALLAKALDLGAECLATGHYARIKHQDGIPQLWRGLDRDKDQSYFLFATTLEELTQIRFPLGDLTKQQTRELAHELGLHLAHKRESQDVCFVPDGDYGAFFARQGVGATCTPGSIVDVEGRHLGEHKGLGSYTIGQRKGLGIAAPYPLYVTAILPELNRLVVGPASSLVRDSLEVEHLNWLDWHPLVESIPIMAQIRYASSPQSAVVTPLEGNRARVVFNTPQRAIAPGQVCVFSLGDRIMGGGWIR